MTDIAYSLTQLKRSSSDEQRLFKIIAQFDVRFIPPLSTYVVLSEYCHKLTLYAENVVISLDGEDIGFVCFYANSEEGHAFVSAVAVDSRYSGKGLGMILLKEAMRVSSTKGMTNIRLEVNEANFPALRLYKKAGFKEFDKIIQKNTILMERPLPYDTNFPK